MFVRCSFLAGDQFGDLDTTFLAGETLSLPILSLISDRLHTELRG